jgi:hypothetical protein
MSLQDSFDGVGLFRIPQGKITDNDSATGKQLHKAFCNELEERFAERGATDTEAACGFRFGEPFPRAKSAVDNVGTDRIGNPFTEGFYFSNRDGDRSRSHPDNLQRILYTVCNIFSPMSSQKPRNVSTRSSYGSTLTKPGERLNLSREHYRAPNVTKTHQ